MAAQIVSLLRFPQPLRDWSQQELAEFYRVESALIRAGMAIETERGLSDDGDPWFAFCRAEDGEVFIHFARIDGEYILAGPGYEGISRGRDFAALVRDLISRHPLVQPAAARSSSNNVFLHPAALLIAVVATAFFKTGEAKADDHVRHDRQRSAPAVVPLSPHGKTVAVDADQTLAVVASAVIALDQTGSLLNPANAVVSYSDVRAGHEAPVWLPTVTDPMGLQTATLGDTISPAGGSVHAAGPVISAGDVGAWLSLAIVLNDLASSAPSAPTLPAPVADTMAAIRPVSSMTDGAVGPVLADPARAGVEADHNHPILVVELTPGALPDVTAIRVIRDNGGIDLGSVVQVARLPDVLASFIAHGAHLTENGIPTDDIGVTSPDASFVPPGPTSDQPLSSPSLNGPPLASSDQPVSDQPVSDHSLTDSKPADSHSDDSSAVSTTAPTPVATPAAPVTTPAPAPVATAPVFPTPVAHDGSIDAALAYFIAHTTDVEVLSQNHEIVVYDGRLTTNPAGMGTIDSVTYDFSDGSSLSLVGSTSALPDLHGLH